MPADPPGAPGAVFGRFLMDLGLHLGRPARPFSGFFGDVLSVVFWYGPGVAFCRFCIDFGRHFGAILGAKFVQDGPR